MSSQQKRCISRRNYRTLILFLCILQIASAGVAFRNATYLIKNELKMMTKKKMADIDEWMC